MSEQNPQDWEQKAKDWRDQQKQQAKETRNVVLKVAEDLQNAAIKLIENWKPPEELLKEPEIQQLNDRLLSGLHFVRDTAHKTAESRLNMYQEIVDKKYEMFNNHNFALPATPILYQASAYNLLGEINNAITKELSTAIEGLKQLRNLSNKSAKNEHGLGAVLTGTKIMNHYVSEHTGMPTVIYVEYFQLFTEIAALLFAPHSGNNVVDSKLQLFIAAHNKLVSATQVFYRIPVTAGHKGAPQLELLSPESAVKEFLDDKAKGLIY
jgi:gas vesicle protein